MIKPLLIRVSTASPIDGSNKWQSEPVKPGDLWRIKFAAFEAGATYGTQWYLKLHTQNHDYGVYQTNVTVSGAIEDVLLDLWLREGEWLVVIPVGQTAQDTAFFVISGEIHHPDDPPAPGPGAKPAGQSYA